jgi:hypothetical protein
MTELAIPPSAGEVEIPLTSQQWRLWFLRQLEPASSAYNVAKPVRLQGPLNVAALHWVFDQLVRRHEALRTRIVLSSTGPVQRIEPPLPVRMRSVDLSRLGDTRRWGMARRLAEREAGSPINLSSAPLFRATLVRLSDADHVLLLTLHHIASDAFSLAILIEEMPPLYGAALMGGPSPLAEAPAQYRDFAAAQRELAGRASHEGDRAYWRQQLSGAPRQIRWRPGPPGAGRATIGEEIFSMSPASIERLSTLLGRTAPTLFPAFLSIYALTLAQTLEIDDIVIGTSVANRPTAALQRVVGFLANTLALRVDVRGNPSFATLLKRTSATTVGALNRQSYPFEKVIEIASPERCVSRNPIFQVFFVLQSAPSPQLELPGVCLHDVPLRAVSPMFDLTLSIQPAGGGFRGCLLYDRRVLSTAGALGFGRRFLALLDQVSREPHRPLLIDDRSSNRPATPPAPITPEELAILQADPGLSSRPRIDSCQSINAPG